jgi:hypothetical protein
MHSSTQKLIILLCVLILMPPPLFAQNGVLIFKTAPLPEKEPLPEVDYNKFRAILAPALPVLKKEPTSEGASNKDLPRSVLLPLSERKVIGVIEDSDAFLTAALFPKRTFNLVNPYEKGDHAFWGLIEKRVREDIIRKTEEKRIIREAWEEWLGIDIWYPYFKAKEIEGWVCDKFKVRIFRFKGRLRFEKEKVTYTFRMQF